MPTLQISPAQLSLWLQHKIIQVCALQSP